MQPRTQARTNIPSIRISWAVILLFEDSKRASVAEANLWEQDDCRGMPSTRLSWTLILPLEDSNERDPEVKGNFGIVAKDIRLFIEVARRSTSRDIALVLLSFQPNQNPQESTQAVLLKGKR